VSGAEEICRPGYINDDQQHVLISIKNPTLTSEYPRPALLQFAVKIENAVALRDALNAFLEVAAFPIIRDDSPPGGFSEVTVNIEVHAEDRLGLLEALIRAIADREIPPEECFGSFGWDASPLPASGVVWSHDNRLHPEMAVIWHRRAIVPPALVLDPKAIIYGRVGHSMMARYRPSEAA